MTLKDGLLEMALLHGLSGLRRNRLVLASECFTVLGVSKLAGSHTQNTSHRQGKLRL